MKQTLLFIPAALLLIFLFISCNKKDGPPQQVKRAGISADTLSTTHTANANPTERNYGISTESDQFNSGESRNDRSLYVLASILIVSLFFRTITLNKVRGA